MILRYRIPELSVLRILSSVTEANGQLYLNLSPEQPTSEYLLNTTLQEDCPIFYQAMNLLKKENSGSGVCDALYHSFVYMDFTGIFDRKRIGRTKQLQEKAERILSTDGIWIDLGMGYVKYLAFERSASMSRSCKLSFVREDLYDSLYHRMMLGMKIGICQLSKLYAYNGLMFTGGKRKEHLNILWEHKVILVDNPKTIVPKVNVITVKDDGTDNSVRNYSRVEEYADIRITEFDGEGLISAELSRQLDPLGDQEHPHHSFQIRLPYIKGVVHEVDFKALLQKLGVAEIQDMFGNMHPVREVEMILTKSMFKGYDWMMDNDLSWREYLSRCREYDHSLYVSGMDSIETRSATELNYQFLTTANITEEEFRPSELPRGWDQKPPKNRHWLTKATEDAYWSYIADVSARRSYFEKIANNPELEATDKRKQQAKLIEKNPLLLNEPIFAKELQDKATQIIHKYENANLLIAGDVRYLSDDLIRLLAEIVRSTHETAYHRLMSEALCGSVFYAPKPAYEPNATYILLRNPHIARNEEVIATALDKPGTLRKKYLSHLHYVLMVDSRSLIPERLGGADFDGDLVKTISDPLLNRCVARNYGDSFENECNLPLLKIPSAEPRLQDARDWKARLEVIKSTFSSRVGQISNAALRRSVIAYDENTDHGEKDRYQKETELLAILTGLEIDSAKSGIKPDLSAYLSQRITGQSLFLQFRSICKKDDEEKWYQPSKHKRLEEFFAHVDWDSVSSNLEKIPYYAKILREHTVVPEVIPAKDEELFTFASDPYWKEKLDPMLLSRIEQLIADYEEALRRCRFLQVEPKHMTRRTDIQRILFSRNQEEKYTTDELYRSFGIVPARKIRAMRKSFEECKWQFTPPEERESVLFSLDLPIGTYQYRDLFCDFRLGGYRILGDILCDLDDMYRNLSANKHLLFKQGDSMDLKYMLSEIGDVVDYKDTINKRCMRILSPASVRDRVDIVQAAKCAIALGNRQFALELFPYALSEYVIDTTPKKRKGWRIRNAK